MNKTMTKGRKIHYKVWKLEERIANPNQVWTIDKNTKQLQTNNSPKHSFVWKIVRLS